MHTHTHTILEANTQTAMKTHKNMQKHTHTNLHKQVWIIRLKNQESEKYSTVSIYNDISVTFHWLYLHVCM